MNTKLHPVADAKGRPLSFFMTAGQISDYTGAAAVLDDLAKSQWLLSDRGYDADWFRDALQAKGIQPCIGVHMKHTSTEHGSDCAVSGPLNEPLLNLYLF